MLKLNELPVMNTTGVDLFLYLCKKQKCSHRSIFIFHKGGGGGEREEEEGNGQGEEQEGEGEGGGGRGRGRKWGRREGGSLPMCDFCSLGKILPLLRQPYLLVLQLPADTSPFPAAL